MEEHHTHVKVAKKGKNKFYAKYKFINQVEEYTVGRKIIRITSQIFFLSSCFILQKPT